MRRRQQHDDGAEIHLAPEEPQRRGRGPRPAPPAAVREPPVERRPQARRSAARPPLVVRLVQPPSAGAAPLCTPPPSDLLVAPLESPIERQVLQQPLHVWHRRSPLFPLVKAERGEALSSAQSSSARGLRFFHQRPCSQPRAPPSERTVLLILPPFPTVCRNCRPTTRMRLVRRGAGSPRYLGASGGGVCSSASMSAAASADRGGCRTIKLVVILEGSVRGPVDFAAAAARGLRESPPMRRWLAILRHLQPHPWEQICAGAARDTSSRPSRPYCDPSDTGGDGESVSMETTRPTIRDNSTLFLQRILSTNRRAQWKIRPHIR